MSKLVNSLNMDEDEFFMYKKIILPKYHDTLDGIIFGGKPYHWNKKFSKQSIYSQLLRLYRLKYNKKYNSP